MPSPFPHRHLLGIEGLSAGDLRTILDEAEPWIAFNRGARKADARLAGLTQINAFFENSTRTLFSFEIAGKRLGAQVSNFHPAASSVRKGESLIDTALTLNAMRPDILVIRHEADGRGGRGRRDHGLPGDQRRRRRRRASDPGPARRAHHPTPARADRRGSRSRSAATSSTAGWRDRTSARCPCSAPRCGWWVPRRCCPPTRRCPAFTDLDEGIAGADVVMMLRIQRERMEEAFPDTIERLSRALRADPGAAGPPCAGCDRHASRADEPRRRDRRRRSPTIPSARRSSSRSSSAWRCGWPASIC